MHMADLKETTTEPDNNDAWLMATEEKAEYKVAPSEEETLEDMIKQIMKSRKMLANASYFAFTATPKKNCSKIEILPHCP